MSQCRRGVMVNRVVVMNNLLGVLVGFRRMFQRLTGMFVPGLVVLLAMMLRSAAMGVRREIVQFGGSVMIFVVRSVVVTSGHL
jgi:hypothetical protein